jgi:hypothetical protein
MHARHPWLAAGPSTHQIRRPAAPSDVGPRPSERRGLEIVDAVLIAILLLPFFLA